MTGGNYKMPNNSMPKINYITPCEYMPNIMLLSEIKDYSETGIMSESLSKHIEICDVCRQRCEDEAILFLTYCPSFKKLLDNTKWAKALINNEDYLPAWFATHIKSCGTCPEELQKLQEDMDNGFAAYLLESNFGKYLNGVIRARYESFYTDEEAQKEVRRQQVFKPIHFLISNSFPTWKTITLGTFKTIREIKKALKAKGIKTKKFAKEILNTHDFVISTKVIEVELVLTTPRVLGHDEYGATMDELCETAATHGLIKCDMEVGPLLALAYEDQPEDEEIYLAMDIPPSRDKDGPDYFIIQKGILDAYLDYTISDDGDILLLDQVIVFMRFKK